MATPLSSVTNEKQLLHYMIDKPETVTQLRENYFVSTEGRDLYDVLYDLYSKEVSTSSQNIIGAGNCVNENINPALLTAILDTPYDEKAFDHYRYLLQEAYAQERIETVIFKEITKSVVKKGRLDVERIYDLAAELQDCAELAESEDSELKDTAELFDSYQATIENRIIGEEFHSTGCSNLDKALATGFSPKEITTIFGSTGVGKSTFSLYLINRCVNREIPCIYFSLEMSETSTMDRWMASRLRIPFKELVGRPNNPIDESVRHLIKQERNKLEAKKRFRMMDCSDISISTIEKKIIKFKIQAQVDYAVVFIDLATMIKEFSGGDAKEYEHAMNRLHQVAKRTKTHIVMIVQAVNKTLEDKRPINMQGVNVFRPILASIKNSGAIAERSRTVLSVFRAKYYARRFFPENPEVDDLDDVVEVQVLKANNGEVGERVLYIHQEGSFRLYPIPEDYIPVTIGSLGYSNSEEDEEL